MHKTDMKTGSSLLWEEPMKALLLNRNLRFSQRLSSPAASWWKNKAML